MLIKVCQSEGVSELIQSSGPAVQRARARQVAHACILLGGRLSSANTQAHDACFTVQRAEL